MVVGDAAVLGHCVQVIHRVSVPKLLLRGHEICDHHPATCLLQFVERVIKPESVHNFEEVCNLVARSEERQMPVRLIG